MSNPFHSFHVQSGGVPLNKLSKHYRNLSKNKTHKFQPLMLQDNKDLVVPMDLLHVPSSPFSCNRSMEHKKDDYYIYPEHSTPTLEIVQIRVQPDLDDMPNYPVIEDDKFEQMFQSISTTPSPKKSIRNQKKSAKKSQQKQKSKKNSKKKKPVK